jgi:uncharacterized protein
VTVYRQCYVRRLASVLGASLMVACGSAPVTRFHSLLGAPATAAASAAPSAAVSTASAAWELLPVSLPAQVDQPQWLLRLADEKLLVLEQERWVAPLADELRAALALRLAAAALQATPKPARITVDVRRFESLWGRAARLEVEWTIRRSGAPELRCQGVFEQPAAASVVALGEAHRANVVALGDSLARAVQRLSAVPAGSVPSCAG